MVYPVTDAVIMPSVADARDTVDRCPRDTTDANVKEYSKSCVLSQRKASE